MRRRMVIGLVLLCLGVAAPLAVRWAAQPRGPFLEIEDPKAATWKIDLAALRRLPHIVRHGEYENQFGNWRDAGTYEGVLLTDLLAGMSYNVLEVVGVDGYRVAIERWRVEDAEYPMVLAYALNGVSVPVWNDGFRLVALPEDGAVSNEEYRAASAGSFWVKNVVRLVLE